MASTRTEPDSRPSIGELVGTLSEKLSQLVRDEIRLAKAELAAKAKTAGTGAGLLGAAAFFGFFAFGALVATAILGLAEVVEPWLAALVVGVLLLLVAGALALAGRKALQTTGSPVPSRAQANLKADVAAVKEGLHHER